MGLSERSPPILAVDIGGTKMAVALVGRDGTRHWSDRSPTPVGGTAEEIWAALENLVKSALTESSGAACGVGCGGPMTRDGELVSPLNIPAWRDFPLKARLSSLTGLDTWVDNDAKALALGEGWIGEAAGCQNYLAMVVSTGVGGGIVLDGRLLDGESGNAGHIGHVVVEPEGRRCACGGRGCLEAEASGTAIAAMTGRPAAFASEEMVARTGRLVGRAVASVANLLDLELVTVAGSVALGFGRPFFTAAQAELSARARLPFSEQCRIVPTQLGPDAPLVGAAAVGWRGLGVLQL
jgi:glucokinase